MDKEMKQFRDDIDAWVKEIRSKQSKLENIPSTLEELEGNMQYNYELIRDIRDDMEEIRQEIKLLKMIQVKLIGKKLKV